MALILRQALKGYHILFEEVVDERTKPLPLVAKPYQALGILALYLMFVLKWGPDFMKKRQPYNLKLILIVYNIFQVIACLYIFYNAVVLAWGWRYKWFCEPVDSSWSEHAVSVTRFVYYYYLTKILDLLDTVFFVLRKKQNQVTFLHLYHHTGMVALVWGATTYYPGGHGTLIGVINCVVHAAMYSYYLITAIYPKAREFTWLKRTITQMQIIQFLWCVIHMATVVFMPNCEYPRWTSAVFIPQDLFMLILFIDFYIKTYIKKPGQKRTLEIVKNGIKTDKLNLTDGLVVHKTKSLLNSDVNKYDNNMNENNYRNNFIESQIENQFESQKGKSKIKFGIKNK